MRIVNAKLTEDNSDNWKDCLKNYLIGHGLWDVVTGTEAKPNEEDGKYKSWTKKNARALHAIQISCEADTLSKFMKNDSAKVLWESLVKEKKDIKYSAAGIYTDLYICIYIYMLEYTVILPNN